MQRTSNNAARRRLALVAVASLWLGACGGGGSGDVTAAASSPAGAPSASGSPGASAAPTVPPSPVPVASTTSPPTTPAPSPGSIQTPAPTPAPVIGAQLVGAGVAANIAVLANGQQVVAWKQAPGVCWRRYTAQSAPLADAQCMATTRNFPPVTVAALGSGFVLAWLEADSDAYNSTYSIKTQVFTQAGTMTGPPRSAPAPSEAIFGFSSATLASGDVAMAYEDGGHIHLLRVDASGTVTEQLAPHVDTTALLMIPAGGRLAALADGGFVVTWDELDLARGRVVHLRLFDAAFQPRSTEILVPGVGEAFGALPAALPDGGFVMMSDGGAVGVQRFTADGAAVGPRTPLDAAWIQTPAITCYKPQAVSCPPEQASVSLLTTTDGGWVAMWNNLDGHGTGVGTFAARFNADGSAASAPVRMDMALVAARSYPVTIATRASDGGFTLAWSVSQTDYTANVTTSSSWLQRFTGGSIR